MATTGLPVRLHNIYYEIDGKLSLPTSRRWRRVASASQVPSLPGCYAIYDAGALAYIGSSSNLRNRTRAYFKCRQVTVKIAPTLRPGEWMAREFRLIARLRPQRNRQWSGRKRGGSVKPPSVDSPKPFDQNDPSTWPPTLTVEQVSAVYQRSPNGLRKACQFQRFSPAPFKEGPYRWRRIDVLRDVIGARGSVASHLRKVG